VSENGRVNETDRLEAAIAESRELIRDAHGAAKDLRAAIREAKEDVQALTKEQVAATVEAEVTRQLDELGKRTQEAINAATEKVLAEFDRFGESLLGKETYWQKVSGRRSAKRPDTDVVSVDLSDNEG
jgi:hypothetical protein